MSTNKITFRHIEDHLKAMVMQNRGGQKVIERILMAYGFKSRQAFCNHLGISQSTMANRYARDTFLLIGLLYVQWKLAHQSNG